MRDIFYTIGTITRGLGIMDYSHEENKYYNYNEAMDIFKRNKDISFYIEVREIVFLPDNSYYLGLVKASNDSLVCCF